MCGPKSENLTRVQNLIALHATIYELRHGLLCIDFLLGKSNIAKLLVCFIYETVSAEPQLDLNTPLQYSILSMEAARLHSPSCMKKRNKTSLEIDPK